MEKTSTFKKNLLQKALLLPLVLLGLLISHFAIAHNVTGYTAGCISGPKYSIDPTVNSVNSSSNYAWQYKNGTTWVCIVNGSNTINGGTYTVSGAISQGTDPAPIVFSGANASLDDVVIRCIIADGSNVNPCSTSATVYNAGTDSKNFIIDVTNTSCGVSNIMSLGNRVWYDKDNTGTNNNENGISEVVLHLYRDDNNDNSPDGAYINTATTDGDGYYMFYNLTPGRYIVGAVTPAGYIRSTPYSSTPDDNINYDNNGFKTVSNETRGNAITLSLGDEPNGNSNITYDFGFLPDCSCTTSSSNLLVNGSFEQGTSSSATGWTATGGTVSVGTGYVACGSYNGFNSVGSGSSLSTVYQDVNVTPGAILTFKGFAGTHTGGIGCSPKLSLVFYNGSSRLSPQYDATVSQDVDINYNQLEQYTITATVPAGATKVRVQSTITCNVMKLDAFCLTTTNTTVTLGNTVWYDTNNDGLLNNGEAGINNATVRLYKASDVTRGAYIATATTNASGIYSFPGLAVGDYVVGVVTPTGYVRSSVNGGDPDDDIDNDNNGQATFEDETRGLPITLSLNGEPNGSINNTYDFGFLPDCNCTNNTSSNLLTNGSFENGTTGWDATGGTITTGTGYVACGSKNGFNNWSSGTSTVFQDVNVAQGAILTFTGYAGTHTPGIACSPKLSLVFYNGTTKLTPQYDVIVDRDVDKNNSQLKQYTITATVPAGATKVRVQSTITCNVMKLDAFCLTSTCIKPTTPTATVTQPTCTSSDNKIVLSNLPSGNWTIKYTYNGGAVVTATGSGTSVTYTNVAAGTYILTVTNAAGCVSDAITIVVNSQPATPTAPVVTKTDPSCSVATGSVVLSGLPATGTWTVTRNPGNVTTTGTGTSVNVNSLAPGTYTFTVTNADGCTSPITTVVINAQPPTPATPTYTVTQPTCSVATGSITLNGLPASGWTLLQKKNGLTGQPIVTNGTGTSYTVTGLGAGYYNYAVKNADGCTSAYTANITINAQPTAPLAPMATFTQTICGNATTASIKLSGLPATGNWTITRTGPGTTTSNGTITGSGTSTIITGLAAGTYTFKVTNADGCTSDPTTVVVGTQAANATLGGKTFIDANKDGSYNASTERVLSGVAVSLYMDANNDGNPDGAAYKVANTVDGTYSFTNVCPGSYIIGFGLPDGYVRTLQLNLVNGDFNDSDPSAVTGFTSTITIASGITDNTNDAGYYTSTILPVGFGNITTKASNCEVVLSFEVLNQKNTKQFDIQYSKDAAEWSTIGVVSAKASSASAYTYSFTHTQPAIGVNLYRIRVVDNDGKLSYSQVVTSTSVCGGKGQISVYPNPASEMLNVSLPATYQDAKIQLFNGTGQMVISDVRKTGLVRTLNTQNLTPGIYLLKVVYNNNVVMTQKVVKGE